MTAEEFIKLGNTYLIIIINDELWVDCYKTSQVEFTNEGRILEIHEDEIHNAYISLYDMEVNNLYMCHRDWDDGHTEEVLIYDTNRSESLRAAYEKLKEISNKFSEMKKSVDGFKNFVYYDMSEKTRIEKLEKLN